ncbi:thermonuclease family protein [Azospirillum sp.]|uniref:thermonuclease family protein n=1 Tax=Azospirillum sp. TaxID=34012 RepID=UPI003D724DF0
MRRPRCFELIAILLAVLPAGPVSAATAQKPGKFSGVPNTTIKGEGKALEGDLLSVAGTTVRLMGIDAPDPGQKCKNRYGHELDCFTIARDVLATLIKDQEVECTVADEDRNRQKQGECRVRGIDLGGAMVARGWAFQFWGRTQAYQSAEAYAQSKRMGLWAGRVEKPWEWRSRRLREQAR